VSDLRVGIGVDAHALEPGVPLVLGGVPFRSPRGLAGHSDGDVVTHALIDALLGAAGLGDIGTLFPADDPELQGISSLKLLREAYAQVRKCGYELVNADVVLIGQEPKIAPVREQMQSVLAGTLELDRQRISVRATTTDELGFTGRGEGLAAHAIALLQSSA
jgi:2-C-methyl-D-erythritol 2,4-cyclodiphosphate synthase